MKRLPHSRFRDPGSDCLDGRAVVVCPRCAGPANADHGAVACTECSFSRLRSEPNISARPIALVHANWVPRCVKCGAVLPKTARRMASGQKREVATRCMACKAVATYPVRARPIVAIPHHDPDSGLPYYLATPFRAHTLWARNLEHLGVLERYVSATVRERALGTGNMTWLAMLPAWIKAGHNRRQLLKSLQRLRASLPVNPWTLPPERRFDGQSLQGVG